MTQQAQLPSLPDVLPDENPFAFRTVGRLRNDYKRRRRRGPEGVAHSAWFTPTESSGPPPAHSRWRARIPFPVGASRAECRRRSFGAVVLDANQPCLTLEARCWLARAIGASLLPSPPNLRIPFLFFLIIVPTPDALLGSGSL